MTDTQLTVAAMLLELGIPIVLLALLFIAPRLRPFCYSVLGAVSPFLFAYLSMMIAAINSTDGGDEWAAGAIWSMSFFAYAIVLTAGAALGLVSRPKHSALRFMISSLVSIGIVSAMMFAV